MSYPLLSYQARDWESDWKVIDVEWHEYLTKDVYC